MIDQAMAELVPLVGVRAECAAVGEAQARWYRRHIRLGRSRTATMLRLSSGRRGGMRPGRLVACASWLTTGPTGASGATPGRRPVAATTRATTGAAMRRPVGATSEATAGGDRSTVNATTATSAPCSRVVARPPSRVTGDRQPTSVRCAA
jgi:hypothetical protein